MNRVGTTDVAMPRSTLSGRASRRAFAGVCALVFAGSVAAAIHMGVSMATMAPMPMPGGWTMSMAWIRMPGQTWPGAAAAFLGTWIVMMAAMMLPWLFVALSQYRTALGPIGEPRLVALTASAGIAYFVPWALFGMAAYAVGAALAAIEMQFPPLARAVPIAAGALVLTGGALQFTAWKAHHLACCCNAPDRSLTLRADAGVAWRHGLRLGLHCIGCSTGYMAILFGFGVMNLGAMAMVTLATTGERLAPEGRRTARAIGTIAVAAGALLVARASGLA